MNDNYAKKKRIGSFVQNYFVLDNFKCVIRFATGILLAICILLCSIYTRALIIIYVKNTPFAYKESLMNDNYAKKKGIGYFVQTYFVFDNFKCVVRFPTRILIAICILLCIIDTGTNDWKDNSFPVYDQ